jgi:hypothetical protein
LDTRGAAASLVFEVVPMVELVVTGAGGCVYLYHVLRSEPRDPDDAPSSSAN